MNTQKLSYPLVLDVNVAFASPSESVFTVPTNVEAPQPGPPMT